MNYLSRPIADLEVSVRVARCLAQLNPPIKTVGDLTQVTREELLRQPNFGRQSLRQLDLLLWSMGLRLAYLTR